MTDSNRTPTSRRTILKLMGVSLAGLTGASGVGAASTGRRRQRQQARNTNDQFGFATADGEDSQATVTQQSSQTIDQNQRATNNHRRGRTKQSQDASNENVQFGDAFASNGGSASVNQESSQSISQTQQVGRDDEGNGPPPNSGQG